ncbi:unnamed protein product [Brassica napus]|uniref:(rape) hypothetical protein n=1 Tax=Brassica napus TaxID=3708 RepID=A0A816X231_BRANA|nr:unnamed protein product [Brassica napus]
MTQLSSEVTIVQVFCNKFNFWDVRVEDSHALAFKEQKDEKVISWNWFFCQDGMLGYHIFRSISILPRRLSKALSSRKPRILCRKHSSSGNTTV